MELGGLWCTNVLNLTFPPQRHKPDTQPEHQDPVSHTDGNTFLLDSCMFLACEPAHVGGSPEEAGVSVAHRGDKDTGSTSFRKYSFAWALPESAISPTKESVVSCAGSPQAKQPYLLIF